MERAYVVGASQSGYIATNYALYAPERVEKLVLLGPMGYAGTESTALRIMLVTFFPIKPLQERTVHWALGDNPLVLERCGEWFREVMNAIVVPAQTRPKTFTLEQLENLTVPTLLALGEQDNLVGDPDKATQLARNIPDIQIEVLNTGHAIGVEQPDHVNTLILEFFE